MTFSKLGISLETTRTLDPQAGKEKVVYSPKINPNSGKAELVYLPQASRRQGTYIIGATGTGKSGLITNLVLQDIKQGKGVAVLDPHTDLTNSILARLPADREKDVILLDALDKTHVFGLNLYQCDDPTNDEVVQETYERVEHIFELLWLNDYKDSSFGPQVTEGLLYSTYALIYNSLVNGCSMLELPLLFRENTPRAHIVKNIQDSMLRSYWEEVFNPKFDDKEKERRADMVLNKLNRYITNPIFRRIVGQSRTTIDVSEVMDNGKILLVKLPGKFEKMTELLGAMIIAQILAASYAREKKQKRRQFNIYADEFQRFATEDFAKLLTEASRKYNTPVTIAHQARDFIDLKNKAASVQVGNLIVLRISDKDAKELVGNFDITPAPATESKSEAIRTPVMEPIQHMITRGVHPLPWSQNFINVYGQELVNGAKKEEELERDYTHAINAYSLAVARYGYGAMVVSPPSRFYRFSLAMLNQLLYQTMIVGKQGGNTDTIPFSQPLISCFIEAMLTVPIEVKLYQQAYQQYLIYVSQQQIQLTDWNTRQLAVQNRLALLQLPQSTPRQNELTRAQMRYTNAVNDLRSVLRRSFIGQVEEITKRCAIVQRGNRYYRPNVGNQNSFYLDLYTADIDGQQLDFQSIRLWELGYSKTLTPGFGSFDAALLFHCQALRFLWFRVEHTLRNQNWWQYKQSQVLCSQWVKKPRDVQIETIETLIVWTPKPGIERTWYTTAMLEHVVDAALQAFDAALQEAITLKRGTEWCRDMNITYFLPASIGGRDYQELAGWTNTLKDQTTAGQEVYEAQEELTKLREEIAKEVRQEQESLQSELDLLAQLQKHKPDYDKFIGDFTNQLRMVMRELATPEGRIEDVSGIWKEQPIGQMSYPDTAAKLANELSNLPNHIARIRITNEAEELVEHTIRTLKPEPGLDEKELDERIARIRQNMIDMRYYRAKTEVDEDIRKRHEVLRQNGHQPPRKTSRVVEL